MKTKKLAGLIVGIIFLASASTAMAIPYASGVTQSGSTVSFILNQDAFSVQAILDGGAQTLNLSTTAGQIDFDMTGYSAYQIKVIGNEAPGWTQYVADQTSTSFYSPLGVSINKIPSDPNFGTVYVSNAQASATTFGRTTNDAIYMLRADGAEIGSATGGADWTGTSSPFKSTIGPDGHLYVVDYSNDLVYEFNDDMSMATPLIDASNKTTSQWVGAIYVEGTQADGDREIYLVNTNYNDTARKGLIGYDLGGNAAATSGDTGTQVIGPSYYTFYPYDVARDSNDDWYLTQYRYDPTQAPAISKFDGSLVLPINTALWETAQSDPYNGAYCLDIYEDFGWVAYGNYYDGWVHIFSMDDGSYIDGFDAGSRLRDLSFDAVGNLVTVDNLTEWARFWSPGGYWESVFASDGTFTITQGGVEQPIPEPATMLLLGSGLFGLAGLRRKFWKR